MRQSWTMLGDARASSVFEIRRSETVCEKNGDWRELRADISAEALKARN